MSASRILNAYTAFRSGNYRLALQWFTSALDYRLYALGEHVWDYDVKRLQEMRFECMRRMRNASLD